MEFNDVENLSEPQILELYGDIVDDKSSDLIAISDYQEGCYSYCTCIGGYARECHFYCPGGYDGKFNTSCYQSATNPTCPYPGGVYVQNPCTSHYGNSGGVK